MKLWRKMAMKQGKRTGRQIKYVHQMQEHLFKQQARVYPLLAQLLVHAGYATIAPQPTVETANEVV